MKKIIGFAVTVFTVATLFAAARPSLDGRALVADTGTMPKGLFARTIGYLPGDSVAVTNPATGSTVDVLILGAIDPTEGVAILLSPEAADKLNIKKDSNVQVKITKRAGSLDEAVSGTAMLAEGEDEYLAYADEGEEAVEEIVGSDIATIAQEYTPGGIVEEYDPSADGVGTALPTFDYDDGSAASTSDYDIPSYTSANDAVANPAQPVIIEYTPYPTEEATASSGIVEEIPEDTAADFGDTLPTFGDDSTALGFDDTPVDTTDAEVDTYLNELATSLQPSELSPTEFVPDAPSDTEVTEYSPVDFATPDSAVTEDSDDAPDVAPAFDAAARSEYYTIEVPAPSEDTAPAVEENPADDTTDFAVAESPALEDTVTVPDVPASVANTAPAEAYQSIVLVPAGENPPESDVTESPALEDLAPSASVAPVAEVAPAPSAFDSHLVPSLKDLQSGAYYVQIASLGNRDNINAILDKYAEKYPIVLVPLASGAAHQVLVGPLTVDEYNTVREKFKSFGFKDAFLRKIR